MLRVYPGVEGDDNRFELYEDDGISQQYADGRFAKTGLRYTQTGKNICLTVDPANGSYEGQPTHRAYTFELAGFGDIKRLKVNGKKARAEIDGGRCIVKIPSTSVRKPIKLEFSTL